MKISIIIPVYNVEKYLRKCLDSVVNQTYKNLEIVIVQDFSTDNSLKIINEYDKKYKNIKVFEGKKIGVGAARNVGLDNCTGKYVIFLDSDDYMESTTIEKLYNSIIKNNSDMAICGFYREDEDTHKIYSKEMVSNQLEVIDVGENNISDIAFMFPAPWGKLIKKSVIGKNRFVLERDIAGEDLLFLLNYIINVKKISYINQPLIHYIIRKNSLTKSLSNKHILSFQKELLKVKEKYNKLNLYYLNLLDLVVFIHMAIALPHRMAEGKSKDLKKIIMQIKDYMDSNFSNWRNIKLYCTKKSFVTSIGIYISVLMYKINLFNIFIKLYNFMINKLKLNLKW